MKSNSQNFTARYPHELVIQLNQLITAHTEGERFYYLLASLEEDPLEKQFFQQKAQQRKQFKTDLQALVHALGGEVETGHSITRDLQYSWLEMQTKLTGQEQRLHNKTMRQEDVIIQHYSQVIQEVPEKFALIREVLDQHRTQLLNTRNRIKEIEEGLEEHV